MSNIELNSFCININSLEKNIKTEDYDECCVCLDIFNSNNKKFVMECCKQHLHINCYIEWILVSFKNNYNIKCPVCRRELLKDDINNNISIKMLIEFKLKYPKYTDDLYDFIEIFYTNYIVPDVVIRINRNFNSDEMMSENNYLNNYSHHNYIFRTRIKNILSIVLKIIFFFLFFLFIITIPLTSYLHKN